MAEPLVVASGLGRTFGRGPAATNALSNATCVIYPGDRIALMGPSGSGKSTLVHLLGGLDEPSSGVVSWPGIGSRAALRPGNIVDVFQGPSLLPPLTVIENVRLPLLLQGRSAAAATEEAAAALALFGLRHLRDKLPEEISGGQAQRVAIARALAVRPVLMLADEPTGQLDSATALGVLDTLLGALDEIGTALLVSTHDPAVARRLRMIWTMSGGRLCTSTSASPESPAPAVPEVGAIR